MGASLVYLEKPNKDIQFDSGENQNIKFVAGSMQGWRINMVRKYSSNGEKEQGMSKQSNESVFWVLKRSKEDIQ